MQSRVKETTVYVCSAEETFERGKEFGKFLASPAVVACFGDLGAGKTTFIRGLAVGAANIDPREVSSPTFNYLNIYRGETMIYHFDLYRLPSPAEFLSAGFDEFLHLDGICCIEWSERISSLLSLNAHKVHLSLLSQTKRKIIYYTHPSREKVVFL